MLALGAPRRPGRLGSFALSGFKGVDVFGDVRGDRFLQLAEFRIGTGCRIGDRGLACALLGKARGAGVREPRFVRGAIPVL